VGVPPQRQQQHKNYSDPVSAGSTQQAEHVDAENGQDDTHSGAGDEDGPQKQEYDVEENSP
jgi:hypothetical protein